VIRTLNLHRALRLGLLLIAVVMVSTVGTKPAMAKAKSCADQVIADWYDDGRVGKIYPLHCYTEAIAKLPPDVLDYSNAKEEIGRALAFAKQGKPDPGGSDPSPGSTATTETQATTTQPTTTTATTTAATTTTRTSETPPTKPTTTVDAPTTAPVPPADTSGPSSVPVPLLVLGGLAVLLLAAGSAGYLRRRMNGGDDADGSPPAAPPVA
jgi:cobalamin biosynthesis Mg chelatase CobN